MYTLLLLIILLFILVFSYILFDFDLLSPSFVATFFLCVAIVLILVEYDKLYYILGFETGFIIIIGLLSFIFVELIFKYIYQKGGKVYYNKYVFEPIHIQKWKIILLILLDVIVLIATYREICRIATFNTNFELSILNRYKLVTSFGDDYSSRNAFNSVLTQISKISMASAYICTYYIAYSLILYNTVKKDIYIYTIPIILWLPMPILKANRLDIIQYVVATIVYVYFLTMIKKGWKVKSYQKFIKKMIFFVPIFFVMFYVLKLIMGIGVSSEKNIIDYIFAYVSGGIVNLEAYVEYPVSKSFIWGKECLYRIYNALYGLGLYGESFTAHLEFRTIARGSRMNIYTYFRRPLQDFGYLGMCLVVSLSSAFYCGLYYHLKKNTGKNKSFSIICYGLIFYPIVLITTDFYIKNIITLGMPVTIIIFWINYKFLITKINIRFRKIELK